jgi:6-pyruvoyltetrahydropterin/6-carboxytetrahydropterin synthase
MYITKEFKFESSHVVPDHPGKCSRLHGHSYKLTIGLRGAVNPKDGFVIDFADLGDAVKPLVEVLDHRHLNFFIGNPTAENIAAWFGQRLSRMVDGFAIRSLTATIQETASSSATWDTLETQDRDQGQKPSMFRTGVPLAVASLADYAEIGPVRISLEEHHLYIATFKLACRETANRINGIRVANRDMIPDVATNMTGTVKETH